MKYVVRPNKSKNVPYFLVSRLYDNTKFFIGVLNEKEKIFTKHLFGTSCREAVVNFYAYRLYYKKLAYQDSVRDGMNIFHTPSIVIAIRSTDIGTKLQDLNKIVRLLNKFEKKMRWKQTKIHLAGFKGHRLKPNERMLLIRFSKCWLNNPHFFYIYLGFYKIIMFNTLGDNRGHYHLKFADSLEQFTDRIAKTKRPPSYEHIHLWLDVIKQRKQLFKGFSRDSLYLPANKNIPAKYNCGIATLCSSISNRHSLKIANLFKNEQGKGLGNVYKKWLKTRTQKE